MENDLLIDLFFLEGWDKSKKKMKYQSNPAKITRGDLLKYDGSQIKSKILKSLKIKAEGLNTWELSFSSESPKFSKEFLDKFVKSINKKTRKFLSYSQNIQTNYLKISKKYF